VTHGGPAKDFSMQRSSRDSANVPKRLAEWLAGQLPDGAEPTVTLHTGIAANGMSSETLVLDASWTEKGTRREGEFVARVAPAAEDVPVFPAYRLQDQFDAMRLAGEQSDVPVPTVRWLEPTGSVLGTPFFLMDRVEGAVPPDVLPYNFGDNWLFDADSEQQRRLQDSTVAAIAGLHGIADAASTFGFLDADAHGDSPLRRNLARTRAWYDYAVTDGGRSPLIERGLAWLEANVPTGTDTVLCWGDARIGNVLYREFEPVGVLDWEMATVGPREMDLAWLVFAHRVFESIAGSLGLPGMPDFLREDEVRSTYAEITGVEVGDLAWFQLYDAVQWAIVFLRTGARQVRFGEIEPPDDAESLMHHRPLFEQLLGEAGA
jgi:aminoglycoside phosphotransferase (APT) family kinase protein